MCPRSIARVPSSQVLPGFLNTAHHQVVCVPLVFVPDVIGALAVWRQNNVFKTYKKKMQQIPKIVMNLSEYSR